MKHTSSSRAIELARRAVQQKSKTALTRTTLSAPLWIPSELSGGLVYCQYAGCNKRMKLEVAVTSPVPIMRMVDGELFIAEYPLLTFCSSEHLLAASLPFGTTMSEAGEYRYPVH